MKKDFTELVIILDQSGSMEGLRKDVIGGFNSLIEKQKKLNGEIKVTTVLFSNNYKYLFKNKNIKEIKAITEKEYSPLGSTALLDAVGDSVNYMKNEIANMKEEERPENVIFSIMTDGYENSSREYNKNQIKKLIEEQEKIGWQFLYQAANIDAFDEGGKLGINSKNIVSFSAYDLGVENCFCKIDDFINDVRIKKKK